MQNKLSIWQMKQKGKGSNHKWRTTLYVVSLYLKPQYSPSVIHLLTQSLIKWASNNPQFKASKLLLFTHANKRHNHILEIKTKQNKFSTWIKIRKNKTYPELKWY